MSKDQIYIGSGVSIELRRNRRRKIEIPIQTDFLLLHTFKSGYSEIPDNSTILVNPNQSIELRARKGELMIIRLAPALLIETATRLRLLPAGSQLLFRKTGEPQLADARLRETLESIRREIEGRAAGWTEMIGSLINQLAVHLMRNHINAVRADDIELSRVGLVDRRLRRAIEFMHDNCYRELSLAEIASAAYLSEFHFSRLFKKITGATPHAYLASLRIERARKMLAETDASINEIGASVGYATQSHFTKVFREATGMTPREFRMAARR